MIDGYGRNVDYMRVSITDRCNLRCRYCIPNGIPWIPMEEILTLEEIVVICQEAAALGIRKIKITGGEPLVRKGCTDLIRMLKAVPGIEQVTLTTNGVLLKQYAEALSESGLDAVNVSLDTLDAKQYKEITGFDSLTDVLAGIEEVRKYSIPLKINAVLQRGINEMQWKDLMELARDRKIDVRFIEMMPIGYGKRYETIANTQLLEQIRQQYGELEADLQVHGNGPAVYYRIPGFAGSIGCISAIHGKFCGQCNRIRLTSTGQLKPCLCFAEGTSVREAVRRGEREEVRHLLIQAIAKKPAGHTFENWNQITEQQEMAKIGG